MQGAVFGAVEQRLCILIGDAIGIQTKVRLKGLDCGAGALQIVAADFACIIMQLGKAGLQRFHTFAAVAVLQRGRLKVFLNQRIIIVHGDGFTLVAGAVLGQHIALAQGGKAYGTEQQRHAEKSNESVFLHATSLH